MKISFQCPSCHKRFELALAYAGRKGRCPSCSAIITIPAAESAATVAGDYSETAVAAVVDSQGVADDSVAETTESEVDDESMPAIVVTRRSNDDRRARNRPRWVLFAVIAAAAVLVFFGGFEIWYLGRAQLVVDWPEWERAGGSMTLDGKEIVVPTKGRLKFDLGPGKHTVVASRDGYLDFKRTVTLGPGESKLSPKWTKKVVVTDVPGFTGWKQQLAEGRRLAASQKGNLLLAFSQASNVEGSMTRALCIDVLGSPQFEKLAEQGLARVVFDFSQADLEQTGLETPKLRTLQEYAIHNFPTLILCDGEGVPVSYFRGYAPSRKQDCLKWLEQADSLVAERDRLFQHVDDAAAPEKLAAAVAACEWLQDHDVARYYPPSRFQPWLALAQQRDPENREGQYESIFAAFCVSQYHASLVSGRTTATLADDMARHLTDWKRKCTFRSPDRAFDLHFLAWQLMAAADRPDADAMLQTTLEIQPAEATRRQVRDALVYAGSGSGFVVADGGYILTNYHVIHAAGSIEIEAEGQRIPAEPLYHDDQRDMALLRASASQRSLRPLRVAAQSPDPGDGVVAIGFPQGSFRQRVGSVTGKLDLTAPGGERLSVLTLDSDVYHGSSGGPICNLQGDVVGMVTLISTTTGTLEGGAIRPEVLTDFLAACRSRFPEFHPLADDDTQTAKDDWAGVVKRVSPSVVQVFSLRAKASPRSESH